MNSTKIVTRCLPMISLLLPMSVGAQTGRLESDAALESSSSVSMTKVSFKGKSALRLTDVAGAETVIPLQTENFTNGTIEADIAGQPRAGAPEFARGFVGIAFRVAGEKRYEAIYLRPTNGRSPDQLSRNHTAQYISSPDHGWERLRKEHPGKYESYANMAPGEWSKVRIVVEGERARLYINNERQPALIVNDLKLGANGNGGVALWVGPHTEAHFANVAVAHKR